MIRPDGSLTSGEEVDVRLQLGFLVREHQSFRAFVEDLVHEAVSSVGASVCVRVVERKGSGKRERERKAQGDYLETRRQQQLRFRNEDSLAFDFSLLLSLSRYLALQSRVKGERER